MALIKVGINRRGTWVGLENRKFYVEFTKTETSKYRQLIAKLLKEFGVNLEKRGKYEIPDDIATVIKKIIDIYQMIPDIGNLGNVKSVRQLLDTLLASNALDRGLLREYLDELEAQKTRLLLRKFLDR